MKEAKGNCYEAAFKELFNLSLTGKNAKLVHAEIVGQGPIEGVQHGHAWVELDGLAIDKSNGKDLVLPACLYRAIARVNQAENEVQYSFTNAALLANSTGHYGPWDLKTSSGL